MWSSSWRWILNFLSFVKRWLRDQNPLSWSAIDTGSMKRVLSSVQWFSPLTPWCLNLTASDQEPQEAFLYSEAHCLPIEYNQIRMLMYWPEYINVSNYSVKLLLANMGMIAHPSDSAQPVQCGTIVLLSFSDTGPFCSASQLSNLQLWDLKNILHQAQKRKWLKMRHFPHSRWLFLSVYAGNISVPCTAAIPKWPFGCLPQISQCTDAAT